MDKTSCNLLGSVMSASMMIPGQFEEPFSERIRSPSKNSSMIFSDRFKDIRLLI